MTDREACDETVLGFDFGGKCIGVAVGNTVTQTASPLAMVVSHQQRPDWDHIGRLIDEWRPARLIVGIPLTMDDREQHMTTAAQRFGRQLNGRFHLPIVMVDERLSTREAASRKTYGADGKPVSGRLDPVAAQIIIETWFGEMRDNP